MTAVHATELAGSVFAELERVSPFLFSLLGSNPDCVLMVSPEGRIHFANRSHPRHPLMRLVGESVFRYLAPEAHDDVRACLRRVVATGEPGMIHAPVILSRRETRRFETRVSPVRQGGAVVALTLIATDITGHVAMEQRLRDQRDTLEFAIEATGLGLWQLDMHTLALTWDDAMKRIHGRAVAPADFRGALELVHPDDRRRVEAELAEIRATGVFHDLEYRVVKSDGSSAWVLARGRAIRDAGGKVTRLLGGILDISASKHVEEQLRKSEELYRTCIAALEEGVTLQARDTTVIACNASAKRLVGLTKEQTGLTTFDPNWRSIHEDGSPFPPETYPTYLTLTTGQPHSGVILGLIRPDGVLTWLSINSRALYLEGPERPSAAVSSFFDITARKHVEAENERLLTVERAARRRAVLLAETSKILACSLDGVAALDDVVARLVPDAGDLAIVELLDDHEELGEGHPIAIAADDPELADRYRVLGRGGHPRRELRDLVRSGEVRFAVAGSDVAPPVLPGVPATDRLAERMRYRSTMLVPLTARSQRLGVLILAARTREFDADDLAMAEEVALRIAQTLDVARLYGDMEVALKKRDDFIAVASHELRTPLMPLMLQIGRLGRLCRDHPELETLVAPKLKVITRQTDRLHRLIEELLDVSQITSGNFSLELEDLDLAALLRETVDGFSEQLARAGCPIRLELPVEVLGRWDRTRVEQIVSNLLANAMKYGAGKPIDVTLEAAADSVLLAVRDRGIGISPRDQSRVFERFERAESERHYGGLGLGLWITRHVAEAMGGAVTLESAPDAGSTFRVTLPRRPPAPAGPVTGA